MKFTKRTSYDRGYGYQSEYVFEEWSISKYSSREWDISRRGCYVVTVGSLTIAKNYVGGVIKMENNEMKHHEE